MGSCCEGLTHTLWYTMGFAFRYLLSASENLTFNCCTSNLPQKILLCSHTQITPVVDSSTSSAVAPPSCLVSHQLKVSQLCQPLLVSTFLFPTLAGYLRPILQPVSLWFHQGKFISKAQYKTPLWGWCSITQLSSLLTPGLLQSVLLPHWVKPVTACPHPFLGIHRNQVHMILKDFERIWLDFS